MRGESEMCSKYVTKKRMMRKQAGSVCEENVKVKGKRKRGG